MADLVVTAVAVKPDGSETELLAGTRGNAFRDQRQWGLVWKLMGVYAEVPRADGMAAFYEREVNAGAALPPPSGSWALRFYRASFSTLPADRGRPPVRRDLVAEMPAG